MVVPHTETDNNLIGNFVDQYWPIARLTVNVTKLEVFIDALDSGQ